MSIVESTHCASELTDYSYDNDRNFKVIVRKGSDSETFSLPEALLLRASETIAHHIHTDIHNSKVILLLNTSHLAFGKLLQFIYYGKALHEEFGRDYVDIDPIKPAIYVCSLASKWDMAKLHNQSIRYMAGLMERGYDEGESASIRGREIYEATSKSHPPRRYISMWIALNHVEAQAGCRNVMFQDELDDYLAPTDHDASDKRYDYFEQLVKLIQFNSNAVKTSDYKPILIGEYLMEEDDSDEK